MLVVYEVHGCGGACWHKAGVGVGQGNEAYQSGVKQSSNPFSIY